MLSRAVLRRAVMVPAKRTAKTQLTMPRSVVEQVGVILAQAVARDASASSHTPGLGSRMAALFADVGLEEPISEWRGVEPVPAPFEP